MSRVSSICVVIAAMTVSACGLIGEHRQVAFSWTTATAKPSGVSPATGVPGSRPARCASMGAYGSR